MTNLNLITFNVLIIRIFSSRHQVWWNYPFFYLLRIEINREKHWF